MSDPVNRQCHIYVKGKVQRVGFRDKVEDIAYNLGLTGYVQNQSSNDVVIVIEGEDEKINQFIQQVRDVPPPVKIKSLDVTEYPYSGDYSEFSIIRGEVMDEFAERFDTAVHLLYSIDQKQDQMLDKQDQMLSRQDQMLDKQDQMLDKQDQMLDKQDRMLGKQDQMIRKQDDVIGIQIETLNEIKGVRSDFQKTFTEELMEIRGEIRELRSAMMEAGYLKKADVR
ncbi:MAG: Acylphosphatase [Euryarchaeota archaeon ADurb.Bin165]|jgi:acylphosphatase|uniref:acylphosphatase n=1 Tax=Methanospirillum sp. TaxID=45200 RepID=UPI0009CC5CBF|nr:acylphosphatase [Methanospirillum sp.]OQB38933.1 MAG: Acylphosphatase [Euryarchaeota archaeon ADurb.Bin165]